jgi:hypothetical protein
MSLLLTGYTRRAIRIEGANPLSAGTGPQEAHLFFNNSGSIFYTGGDTLWYSAVTLNIGSQYEIRATISTAPAVTPFVGPINTWLLLDITRSWSLSATTGQNSGALLIEIRKAGETEIMGSGVVQFDVEVVV